MNEEVVRYTLSTHHAEERVDRTIAFFSGLSRSKVAELIANREILRNGIPIKKGSELAQIGDVIEMPNPMSLKREEVEPDKSIEFEVIFEDDSLIVINKPSGLIVHPGSGVKEGTLVNGLAARFPDLQMLDDSIRLGLVHRLDKGTSGLVLVARTQEALTGLKSQMQEREIRRQYLAISTGHIKSDKGIVDAPLGRDPKNPLKRAVLQDGKHAKTHYQVEQRLSEPFKVSILTCQLETGRTHQIRVHLAAIGFPVVGDELYGGRKSFNLNNRLALHAEKISFRHPKKNHNMEFEAPFPEDFLLLRRLFS
tara:strand:+ start:611 stop:1537 length:927 start_codon:yes stop_codon:yes gene_type:complete